jgi:hypothetical protein
MENTKINGRAVVAKGLKFLAPDIATTYDGTTTSYIPALSGWMDHPSPATPDDQACGPGRWHVMLKCSAEYASLNWWPWHAYCHGIVGRDGNKLACTSIYLRPIRRRLFWRYLRRFGQGAILESANLESANLRGANLQGAKLQFANLQFANLEGANLEGANLRYVNLQYTDLQYANLQGANLEGANLQFANLRGASLQNANLRYADVRYANLQGANLEGAKLQYTAHKKGV